MRGSKTLWGKNNQKLREAKTSCLNAMGRVRLKLRLRGLFYSPLIFVTCDMWGSSEIATLFF